MPQAVNQSSNIPPPPPGYTLDAQSGAIPPPPTGYKLDQAPPQTQQQPPAQPGFFKRLGQSMGIPTSKQELQAYAPQSWGDVADAILGGPAAAGQKALQGYVQNTAQGFKKGYQEASEADQMRNAGQITTKQAVGKTASGALNSVVNAIPLIGPSMVQAGEDIGQENYAGGAGGLTGVIGQVAAPSMSKIASPNSLLGRMLLLGKTPEGAYESAMKPGTTIPIAKRAALAQTALQEGIPVSQKGLGKLSGLIDNVNQEISQKIANDPNKPISTAPAMQNVADLKTNGPFGNQVNPRADLQAIDASGQEFQDIYGDQMPAAQAQAVKQGTYQALSNKYGELGSASTEAQKALARGLKEELANQFPELNDLNARDGRLIDLQASLQRAVNRIGNHQLLGIGTPIVGAAASAVTGSPGVAKVAMVMKAVLDNPAVKSKLAIALSQGKVPSPLVVPKIAAYAGALGRLSQPSTLPFLPGSQQSPAQSPDQ